MEDEEREMLLAIAEQMQLTEEGTKMHSKYYKSNDKQINRFVDMAVEYINENYMGI